MLTDHAAKKQWTNDKENTKMEGIQAGGMWHLLDVKACHKRDKMNELHVHLLSMFYLLKGV